MWPFVEQRFGSVNRRSRKARGKLPRSDGATEVIDAESGALRCVDELDPLDVRVWKGADWIRLRLRRLRHSDASPQAGARSHASGCLTRLQPGPPSYSKLSSRRNAPA
jgi:hypothetical protein